jgi:hypothetical protein
MKKKLTVKSTLNPAKSTSTNPTKSTFMNPDARKIAAKISREAKQSKEGKKKPKQVRKNEGKVEFNDDIKNNLSFFICPTCNEELIVTVNKASVIRTVNPDWMNQKMDKEVIVTGHNKIILNNSLYDEVVRKLIIKVLKQSKGSRKRACKIIGKSMGWLDWRMQKYDIVNIWHSRYDADREDKGNIKLNITEAYFGKK